MSANLLTKRIVNFLNFNGFVSWNVYNGGVYDPKIQKFRKNKSHKLGVFDICGFRERDGKHLEIEIKWKGDKMSPYQEKHFESLQNAGAICFVARDFESFEIWFKELEQNKIGKNGNKGSGTKKTGHGFGDCIT